MKQKRPKRTTVRTGQQVPVLPVVVGVVWIRSTTLKRAETSFQSFINHLDTRCATGDGDDTCLCQTAS